MDSKGFPLGWGALDKKPHLVRWLVVCSDEMKGGLGIRCLSKLKTVLSYSYVNGCGGLPMREIPLAENLFAGSLVWHKGLVHSRS